MRTIEVYTRVLVRPPFDLVLSRPPPTFGTGGSQLEPSSSPSWSRQDYPKNPRCFHLEARFRLLKTQERYKRDFDKKVNTFPNINLRAGDLVFLDIRDSPAEKVLLGRRRNKLDPKTRSPFVVIENHGHTLDIDANGIPECISSDRVRPAPGNVEHGESGRSSYGY